MRKISLCFILCTLMCITCQPGIYEHCNPYSFDDQDRVNWLLNYYQKFVKKYLPEENIPDTLIMYHADDGWGTWNFTAVFMVEEGRSKIILDRNENMRTPEKKSHIHFEKEMTPVQSNDLLSRADELRCKSMDLDTGYITFDGNSFSLLIKLNQQLSAFEWDMMPLGHMSSRFPPLAAKDDVLYIASSLLKLCGIQGLKKIGIDFHTTSRDSVEFYIFLTDPFITEKIEIFLDGQLLEKSIENDAKIKLHPSDTINLYNRIKIIETQFDGTVREL